VPEPTEAKEPADAAHYAPPYAKLMREVQSGFGRTMYRLPEVFGVSRQTLYNWLEGHIPKPVHHERLAQLAKAARVFAKLRFKPTPVMFDRPVAEGKTFLQLLAEGADGKDSATMLVRTVRRDHAPRPKRVDHPARRKVKCATTELVAQSTNPDGTGDHGTAPVHDESVRDG